MARARRSRINRTGIAATLIALATISFLFLSTPEVPVFAAGDEVAATYKDGTLTVYVPSKAVNGASDVSLEVIDAADKPLAPKMRVTRAGRDRMTANIAFGKTVPLEDLAWARMRVDAGGVSKIVSVSEILHVPVVRMFAQTTYAAGSQASVRILTLDSRSGDPLADSDLKVDLVDGDRSTRVFAGRANRFGTVQADFLMPKNSFGARQIKVSAITPLGPVEFAQPIQLVRRDRILLTTDKPLYQPSQTMHLRALSFDGPTRNAVANQNVTLEVEDAKGNKVFKQRGKTDAFGIASADFELADEVNLGPWHVRAILGEGDAATTQEKTVTVDRYVLPKFKVAIELSGDAERQPASYFSPGENVEGKVTAKYLFGKPLANAAVTLTLTTFDVESTELARITGKTNADGQFTFSSKLPDFLAGRSTEQGSAPVSIAVDVKDTADHTENKTRDILVSATPILILAVPESGQLVPGLENRVYLLTTYPDGAPAETTIAGNFSPASLKTSESGVATIAVKATAQSMTLNLTATDAKGRIAKAAVNLEAKPQNQNLMLRTDRAIYKVGDTATLETMSTRSRGAVYIDVVRDGQTLITRAIDTANGRGQLELDLTPEMYGTVEIRAYQITSDADPISDRRLIFVDPADDLKVDVSADRDSFKPGEDARIDFHVTDSAGRGVSAAMGIEIVDEAVFALSDKQPGFAKVFLYLQKELLTPRYEVHQFSFENVIIDDVAPGQPRPMMEGRREEAARVLLAAAAPATDRDVRVERGREAVNAKRNEFLGQYQQRIYEQAQRVATGVSAWYSSHPASRDGFGADVALYAKSSNTAAASLIDPWGNPLVGQGTLGGSNTGYLTLVSLGPDGRGDTSDELTVSLYAQPGAAGNVPTTAPFAGKATVEPNAIAGGRVAIQGTIRGEDGKPLGSMKVTARGLANGRTLAVYSDARGEYSIPNLAPGRYHVVFEGVPYLTTIYKTLTLPTGSRGVVDAQLSMRKSSPVTLTAMQSYGMEEDGIMLAGEAVRGAGGFGRRRDGAPMPPMAAQAKMARNEAAPREMAMDDRELKKAASTVGDKDEAGGGGGGPRVRSFFPETLYTNPALITDGQGRASIKVPLADSITTWRITSLASTTRGALGSSTAPIKVFQDFFIDLDLPVALTEGDAISVPVAVYNYLPTAQQVTLELRQDPWFTLDGDVPSKQVQVGSGEVGVAYFKIKASKIGEQQLQVTGTLAANAGSPGDAVARTVDVRPNGEERAVVINERLEGAVQKDVVLPANALADASKIFVKFYPGALSQVVEGLDSILRMPGGCFEQTSSSTYPNVLVMDYLKTSKKLTPEIQAKAEGFISLGYQRLVTFEVQGGGFSWFGEAPANKILTSYGLQEFYDMSKVHEVDPRLIERTQQWLASQQKPDGSWEPDKNFINEGATNKYNTDVTRITAYIGWSLATTGYKGEAVDKARQYVATHVTGKEDAYTLAVIANFAVDSGKDKAWEGRMIELLAAKATDTGKTAYWKQEGETPTSAKDDSADLETTALAAQALLKSGQKGTLAKKALDYLTSNKDAYGNWQTTQATILALKAFILSFTKGANADTAGTIEVSVDGNAVDRVEITRENNDLLHLIDLKAYTHAGAHKIGLSFNGKGAMQYQIVGRYFVPWDKPANPGEPLSIDLAYDRTTLAQDEMATAKVKVRNNTRATAKMIMVDLGIPPGFEPQGEDFASLVDETRAKNGGKLQKFTITAKQVILYFDGLAPNQTVEFSYKLRAKFPLRAQSFASRVYEYYNPSIADTVTPAVLQVKGK
ncbi:MAG TPA: MG2 domain-containing protein [Blastocatellia bacterium]|nr:MG2 domain-containing protein [Blastocatellia bacterium]